MEFTSDRLEELHVPGYSINRGSNSCYISNWPIRRGLSISFIAYGFFELEERNELEPVLEQAKGPRRSRPSLNRMYNPKRRKRVHRAQSRAQNMGTQRCFGSRSNESKRMRD